MSRCRILIFAVAVSAAAALAHAESFEGVAHFKNSTVGRNADFDYFIKGDKARMEVEGEGHGGKAAIIIDQAARKMLWLVPAQKMAMEMPMRDASERVTEKMKDANVERTGKTKAILGYPTEQLIAKTDQGDVEIWGAKGMGFFAGMHGRPGAEVPAWARDLQKQGFFPLLIIHHDAKGEELSRMEATKIEKRSLSDDLFTVPADFKKFDPGMMRGMGGGAGGPGGSPEGRGGGGY
ncbi:MAG TPA: DUF4412 domain-containing protein [Nitrospirales bacterium]|nr:DUF4412 domain-containing protein [Nitrospirales bacterium]